MSDRSQANTADDSTGQQDIADLKRRIDTLEQQVSENESSGVSRRQTLGLLGGGALLGATGSASAQQPSGGDGDPFADEGHDHSGDVLGEGEPVEAISTEQVNNDLRPLTAAEIKEAIEDGPSGARVFLPTAADAYEIDNPITIGRKVLRVIGGARSNSRGRNPRGHNGVLQKKNDAPLFDIQGGCVTFENVVVSGLGDDGSTAGWYTPASKFSKPMLYNCRAFGCGGDGFHFENANTCFFANCQAHSNRGDGFFIGGVNANASTITSFVGFSNGGHGLNIDGAYGTTVLGGYNAQNGEAGCYLNSLYPYAFGIGGEKNGGPDVHIGEDAEDGFVLSTRNGAFNVNKGTNVTLWDDNPILKLASGGLIGSFMNLNNRGVSGVWNSSMSLDRDYIVNFTGANDGVGDFILNTSEADFANTAGGRGVVVTTPDETANYRIRVNNSGELVTEEVDLGTVGGYPVPNQSLSIDGAVSELANTSGLSVDEDFTVYDSRPASVTGTVWLTWDQSYLYLAADLQDDKHTQPETGNLAIYRGDVLELGVVQGALSNPFTQIDAALTPKGPQVIKARWPDEAFVEILDVPVEIIRNDETNRTVYEVAIPWGELPINPTTDELGLSLAIRDVDEGEPNGFCEWGGGMLGGKSASQFNSAELVND